MVEGGELGLLQKDDIAALCEFGKEQFTLTFGHLYTKEDLESYLRDAYSVEIHIGWLNDDNYRIWVYKNGDKHILGYVLCGTCNLPLENVDSEVSDRSRCGEVKRLYIAPSQFGSGLAPELMRVAMSWLTQEFDQVFLGVYSENFRAQRFYNKLGFKKVGEYGFPVGDHVDREFIFQYAR